MTMSNEEFVSMFNRAMRTHDLVADNVIIYGAENPNGVALLRPVLIPKSSPRDISPA